MKKNIISSLLACCLILGLLPTLTISANAASNSNYTLTGNYADDVISVAVAQEKKTGYDLRGELVTASNGSDWCGNFVWWCGYKAGLVSSGLFPSDQCFPTAINPALWFASSGQGEIFIYENFYAQFLGRTEEGWSNYANKGIVQSVSKSFEPQKGDIIIYGKPQTNKTRVTITHTGYIRNDMSNGKIYTVEGNTGSRPGTVKLRDITANTYLNGLGYPIGYVRPNYDPKRQFRDGTYELVPKCALDSRLDVANGSKEKGANIQIYQANNTEAQQFEFKYLGEGYYQITSKVSGKSLDVQNGDNKSGTNVWQYDSNSTDAQKWMLEKTEDGYYYIVPKLNTNLCLDVYNAKKDNGTNVQVWGKNQSDAQKWNLIYVPANPLPKNLTVSTDKDSYTLGESVLITPSANNATHYAISVWKGAFGTGDRVYVNFKIPGRISFNPTQSGTYTIRADAKNGAGYISTEKTFTVTAAAPSEPTKQKTWGNWSNWSTDYVESSDTRQVETTSVKVAEPYTEYRYGRYIDSTGTHVCWCKKYLESWRSVSGSVSLQYSEWSATRYNANGKAWTCGYCGGDHTGVHHVSSDGRAWWAQFDLPSGSYYWEESRNVDARYETQYRYRDLISR